MNTRKNLSISFISAVTVLIALSGFWQLAAAKSGIVRLVAGEIIGMGRQGLHVSNIPHGVTHVYIDNVGTNLPSRFIHKLDMKYRAPAMEVRFLNAKGSEVEKVSALIYVYFKVG